MSSPTKTSRHEERTDASALTRADLEGLLRSPAPVDWSVINGLLQELSVVPSNSNDYTFASTKDDPLGRSLVSTLLSRNPPSGTLEATLRLFPGSLKHNPVAFFTACKFATPQAVTTMTRHLLRTQGCDESPYPWILSNHVSAEGAKAMLQVYPQGVIQPSACLSGLSPLDFFLMSPEMIKQRNFSKSAWTKFKLLLVAAESCSGKCSKQHNGLSPVHVILQRILSRPDILGDHERARHILWLLQQLRRTDQWVFQKPSSEGLYPLHYVLSHKCTEDQSGLAASRELVKLLLAAHPPSARHALKGRLPIHVAIENGWPCHDLLLSVFPESLNIRDASTGFVPFQAAARSDSQEFSLDVTFELFRANPVHADCRLVQEGSQVGALA